MNTVKSKDNTTIAYDQSGQGPALVLVGGALNNRGSGAELAALLAPHFTVICYDRRGRGDSSDNQPYAVAREVEDIDALIQQVGGSIFLYGHSSGAVLSMEVANTFPNKIKKLALYEPPFTVDNTRRLAPADYTAHLAALVAEGKRGDAVAYFLTEAVDMPAAAVDQMRHAPFWQGMEAVAHTLPYDGMIMRDTIGGKPLPTDRWTRVTMPTLVLDGGASPTWAHHAAEAAAKVLPNATYQTLEGQTHAVAPNVLAPVLEKFFLG